MDEITCTIQVMHSYSGRHLTLDGKHLAGPQPSGTSYAIASFYVPFSALEERLASIKASYALTHPA